MTEVYHRRRWNGDGSFAARPVRPRAVERVLIPRAGEAAQAIDGPAGGPGEPTLGLGVSSLLF
jgi:hypothetical protein